MAVRTRQARGEQRRRHILEAALRVIAERGLHATTHRAVATEAGVPTATTTYYFASLEQLLDEALLLFVEEEISRLGALATALQDAQISPAQIADLFSAVLAEGWDADVPPEVAQFELYLEAARRPHLKAAARSCLDQYARVADAALRAAGAPRAAEGAQAFVALIDGFALHRIAGGVEGFATVTAAMRALAIAYLMDEQERAEWDARLTSST